MLLLTGVGSVRPRPPLHRTRKPEETATQRATPEQDNFPTNVCIIAAITLAVCCLLFIFNPFRSSGPLLRSETAAKSRREIILDSLSREFQELRTKFTQQTRRLWSVVTAATKRVVQDEHPLQPAVLMLVTAAGGSHDVTKCLASRITDAIARAHNNTNVLKLNMAELSKKDQNPDALKLQLDDLLSNSFGSGKKAALLYNIQDLPSRTAMLLHSYCDNVNAPFKDVTLTFTVQMDNADTTDEAIEDHLHSVWSDLDKDTLSPLLSRIGNSIAAVSAESPQTFEKHCKG